MPKRVLTVEMEIFILENYLKMSGTAIAKELGVSKSVVNTYKRRNGFKVSKEQVIKWRSEGRTGRTSYTHEEDEFIKANYLSMSLKKMAIAIKRSTCGISGRMEKMGLVISREVIEQRKKDSYYSKNHVPYNKGKKLSDYMSPEAMERIKVGQFKKGRKPHNTKPVGYISERPDKNGHTYKYIKISDGHWNLYHRQIWEDVNGKIPEEHNIIFKDGNSLNCDIANLIMISNSDLMKMNTIHQYPPELQRIIKLNNRLIKSLKKHK